MKKVYQVPPVGNEISCVMCCIDQSMLTDNKQLEETLLNALKHDNFTVLNSVSHTFTPHGFTLVALLTESHAAIHSYPEHNSLYFHLYSCRGPNDGEKTLQYLKEKLKPTSVKITRNEVCVTV